MDSEDFGLFLKRGGRSPAAVKRCLNYAGAFESFLQERQGKEGLDQAEPEDLEAFVAWIEREPKSSAKTHLWAIRYYYQYRPDEEMEHLAGNRPDHL